MKAEDLIKSKVVFDELEHTYTLDNKPLSGITSVIHTYICPDKYKGISQRTLDAAAEHGHEIHNQVQMIVDGFGYANPALSVRDFFFWANKEKIEFIASEYLVSDEQHFASSIDIIDSDLNLYDVKTTSTLDREYLSWQLSIYAYLFERQNPKLKVKELFGVHLRDGKARVIRVDRIDDAIIADLLCAAADGLPWSNPFKQFDMTLLEPKTKDLARLAEVETAIADIEAKVKAYEEERDRLKAGLLDLMLENNVKSFETERLKLSVREASTRTTLDGTALKKDMPQVYQQYTKTSPVKASLTIKIKE